MSFWNTLKRDVGSVASIAGKDVGGFFHALGTGGTFVGRALLGTGQAGEITGPATPAGMSTNNVAATQAAQPQDIPRVEHQIAPYLPVAVGFALGGPAGAGAVGVGQSYFNSLKSLEVKQGHAVTPIEAAKNFIPANIDLAKGIVENTIHSVTDPFSGQFMKNIHEQGVFPAITNEALGLATIWGLTEGAIKSKPGQALIEEVKSGQPHTLGQKIEGVGGGGYSYLPGDLSKYRSGPTDLTPGAQEVVDHLIRQKADEIGTVNDAARNQNLLADIKNLGGIKTSTALGAEEQSVIPAGIRNNTTGQPIDQIVGELNGRGYNFTDGEQLRQAIADHTTTPKLTRAQLVQQAEDALAKGNPATDTNAALYQDAIANGRVTAQDQAVKTLQQPAQPASPALSETPRTPVEPVTGTAQKLATPEGTPIGTGAPELPGAPINNITETPAALRAAETTLPKAGGPVTGEAQPLENLPVPKAVGEEHVKTLTAEPVFKEDGTVDIKKSAQDIRSSYTEIRNSEKLVGGHLSEDLNKLAPDELNALSWFREAKGNIETLKTWLADKNAKLDPYRADIEAATHLSPEALKANDLLNGYYEKTGQASQYLGLVDNLRESYNSRIYEQSKGETLSRSDLSNLKQSTSHGQARTYDTLYDGITKGGLKPATTNAADLMTIYNDEYAVASTNKLLIEGLKKSGLGTFSDVRPPGYVKIGGIVEDGKPMYVPKDLANGLRSIIEPNFIQRIETLQNLKKNLALIKTIKLGLSIFHDKALTIQTLAESKGGLELKNYIELSKTKDFRALEKDFVEHTGITTFVDKNQDVMAKMSAENGWLGKVTKLPLFKQAFALLDKNNEFLFDKVQRTVKVLDYSSKVQKWLEKNPEATDAEITSIKRKYARHANFGFGGLNWEDLGKSPSMVGIAKLLLLAPDWTYSNIGLVKEAFQKDVGGSAARSQFYVAAIGGALLTEALNKAFTGHFTNQNQKGHEFEVEVTPKTHFSLFTGAIGDGLNLAKNIQQKGPIEGTARSIQSKLGPGSSTAVGLLSNTNQFGAPISTASQSQFEKTKAALGFIAGSAGPAPIGVSNAIAAATSGGAAGPVEALAALTGAAKVTQPPKGKKAKTSGIRRSGARRVRRSRGGSVRIRKGRSPRVRVARSRVRSSRIKAVRLKV